MAQTAKVNRAISIAALVLLIAGCESKTVAPITITTGTELDIVRELNNVGATVEFTPLGRIVRVPISLESETAIKLIRRLGHIYGILVVPGHDSRERYGEAWLEYYTASADYESTIRKPYARAFPKVGISVDEMLLR